MKEITLNQAKSISGAVKDFNFEKLEIAVTLPSSSFGPAFLKNEGEPLIKMQVNQLLMNSNVQLAMSYGHGANELIVALYGPSDLRGFK
jgi:hypothetical protein